VGTDGRTRPAGRGTEVDTGDVVRTNDGRVQMRMTDGAFISLQPNTEFGIKDYRFAGKADGSENALYSLLKGAMRTVTGLIGRTNRNRYQVATPTATVGIRGTGGLIQVLNDGATLVQGTSGIWFLANPAGSIDIPAGVAGIAPVDPKQPPKETVQIPTAGPSPLSALIEFVQGEEREGDGSSVITGGVLVSGSGFAAAVAFSEVCDGICVDASGGTGTAVFNGAGQMTSLDLTSGRGLLTYNLQSGSHVQFRTDGILAWGRWIGMVEHPVLQNSSIDTYDTNGGLHYVIGTPTPTMPTVGQATYTLIEATSPTISSFLGSLAPGTMTGSLSVADWSAGVIKMNLNVSIPSAGLGYLIDGNAQISGSSFSGSFDKGLGVTGTNLNSCASGCTADVQGFFAGTAAARAGVAYQINDDFSIGVVGAAAFAKQ
jgi:hypothetical protein